MVVILPVTASFPSRMHRLTTRFMNTADLGRCKHNSRDALALWSPAIEDVVGIAVVLDEDESPPEKVFPIRETE
jgi:hypothetical protein